MQGSFCRPERASASRVARSAASAITFTSAPANDGARDGLLGQQAQDRLQPVVAGVMQVVGLGGGEQQPVDAARQDGSTASVLAPGRKQREDRLHGALQIGAARAAPALTRRERIDQHDLPVEAGEVIAEERLHDVRLVALEAARQHGAERAARVAPIAAGGSGKKVSSGEPARSPGSRKRPGPGAVSVGHRRARAACR